MSVASANLAASIEAVKNQIVFIHAGYLDRTGDEMHDKCVQAR